MRYNVLLIITWAITPATIRAQETLPLEFLDLKQVYKQSHDPSRVNMTFTSDSQSLILSDKMSGPPARRWTLYSIQDKIYREYGPKPVSEIMPQLVNEIPAGYRYFQTPQTKVFADVDAADLVFEMGGRFYLSDLTGAFFSTDEMLQDPKPIARIAGGIRRSKLLISKTRGAYNGQPIFETYATNSVTNLFFLGPGLKQVPLFSAKDFRPDWNQPVIGNSTYQAAFKKDNKFALFEANGRLPLKPKFLTILPEDDQRYCTAFYANEDKWFCTVLKNGFNEPPQIDYYNVATGQKVGRYQPEKSFQVRNKVDEIVGTDRQGKLIVLTADRAAAILQVVDDQFELLADHSHFPRLSLLHNTATQFAVSPDGKTIALEVRTNEFAFPDLKPQGLALIRLADIARLRSNQVGKKQEIHQKAGLPRGNKTLSDLRQSEIPIAVQRGDEPESIVHLIEANASNLTFSPDSRWLFADDLLFDAADGDTIQSFNEYAQRLYELERFQLNAFCFTDDSQHMATISDQLTIWDMSKKDPNVIGSFTINVPDTDRQFTLGQIREFFFVPSRNGLRMFARSESHTWLFSYDNGQFRILDSRPNDFFINPRGSVSYSKDGSMLYAEALGGAIRVYNIQNGQFEVVSLLKPDGIQWQRQDRYELVTRPLEWAYISHGRNRLVFHLKDEELTQSREFPINVTNLRFNSSSGLVSGLEAQSKKNGLSVLIMKPDFQNMQKALLPYTAHGPFDVANDGKHVAIAHDNHIWILRCNFEKYVPSQKKMSSRNNSQVVTPMPIGQSQEGLTTSQSPPNLETTQSGRVAYRKVFNEYVKIENQLPESRREFYRARMRDLFMELKTKKGIPSTQKESMDMSAEVMKRLIDEIKKEID